MSYGHSYGIQIKSSFMVFGGRPCLWRFVQFGTGTGPGIENVLRVLAVVREGHVGIHTVKTCVYPCYHKVRLAQRVTTGRRVESARQRIEPAEKPPPEKGEVTWDRLH